MDVPSTMMDVKYCNVEIWQTRSRGEDKMIDMIARVTENQAKQMKAVLDKDKNCYVRIVKMVQKVETTQSI